MSVNHSSIDSFTLLAELARARPARLLERDRPVWIFGAGNFGRSLCAAMLKSAIQVEGFVETSPKFSQVAGLPVIDWASFAAQGQNAQLALGIFNRDTPFEMLLSIQQAACAHAMLMPWDSYDMFADALGWRFWLGRRETLLGSLERIAETACRLEDKESRDLLLRICAFRLGYDLPYSAFQSTEDQYFNPLSLQNLLGQSISYVDCGAYEGDTYAELLKHPELAVRHAVLLEPDPENYLRLVSCVAEWKTQAICLPLAGADRYSILSFSAGQGEAGSIGEAGNSQVAAVALDQLLPNHDVDFIKIDVEGAEAALLRGARRLIERCRPVLALSLYHNPQDLWELPELLFEMCTDYRFYVRQHHFNSFDCVLYAVPKRR